MTYDEHCITKTLNNLHMTTVVNKLSGHGLEIKKTEIGAYFYSVVSLNDRKLFSFSNFGKQDDNPSTISRLFFYDKNSTHIGAMTLYGLGYRLPSKFAYYAKVSLKIELLLAILALPLVTYADAIKALF
jgi:hypothetical protein